jgi:threonine dehydrogenase-like Zn-dependent dehydrogenase
MSKALVFERNPGRFALARAAAVSGAFSPVRLSPLRLVDQDAPPLPTEEWVRVSPILAGICGSDLSLLRGESSRSFEPVVSFPFVPGHEVLGRLEDDPSTRVVLEPVLHCRVRGAHPLCPSCASGNTGNCEHLAIGHLKPGLQTGFCADTGGGWSRSFVAHPLQLHPVPDHVSDEEAVMIEPTACAVHAALSVVTQVGHGARIAILGAGTLGLCMTAALRAHGQASLIVAAARYPTQRRLAKDLGADQVVSSEELARAARRARGSIPLASAQQASSRKWQGAGFDAVVDCVGSQDSISQALSLLRPRGVLGLVGMPAHVRLDLAPLWMRELRMLGCYTYGKEDLLTGQTHTFDLATDLVSKARLGRLVSATYPLERYEEAIEHAMTAGKRGSVKIAFEPGAKARKPWKERKSKEER